MARFLVSGVELMLGRVVAISLVGRVAFSVGVKNTLSLSGEKYTLTALFIKMSEIYLG